MSNDGYTGRSVITTFRETLGLGLATEKFGAAFFGNGAWPGMMLKHPGRLGKEAKERMEESYNRFLQGADKSHRTLILEEGMGAEKLTISPEDSQYIEGRQFQVEEVARIFGVPPHMIGADIKGSMTYSNSELESLRLLKHTLGPWLRRIEAAVDHVLLGPIERKTLYAEFLPDALLATDTAGRYAAYKVGLESGFLTVDEVRKKENLPALPEPQVG